MKQIFYTVLFIVLSPLSALDYSSTNTFNRKTINPATVISLLQSVHPLHPEIEQRTRQFMMSKQITRLLSGVDDQKIFFTGSEQERQTRKREIDNDLEERGLQSLAKNSFVIPLDDEWVIKKSHIFIARQNVADTLASLDAGSRTLAPYGSILTSRQWERFLELFHGRIYQNTSRAMVYLRAYEAKLLIEDGADIILPEMHLIHIPGRPQEIEDRNYVILEKRFAANGIPWNETPLAVDPPTIITMVLMIAYTGWWTMQDCTSVIDGKLYYFDHELPNRHDIRHIFNQDKEHFRLLVQCGWDALEQEIMIPYAEKQSIDIKDLLKLKQDLQNVIKSEWD